jgi:hypothetical protein
MKNLIILIFFCFAFIVESTYGQCPDLNGAMVDACGATEGINEFVFFTTPTGGVDQPVSNYTIYYNNTTPPSTTLTPNTLAGSDAGAKTGPITAVISSGCPIQEVTSATTPIPPGSKVMFIPADFDNSYNISAYCSGSSTIYVVYIHRNTATVSPGLNSAWPTNGTMANNPGTGAANNRYLQVGSTSCNGTAAPVKSYNSSWINNGGTAGNGNFVAWNTASTQTYTNNGCNNILLPLHFTKFNYSRTGNTVNLYWQTQDEINTAYFAIEESTDGANFYTIDKIPTRGFAVNDYSYKTTLGKTGNYFYRLMQVDKDARFSYSTILSIAYASDALELSIVGAMPLQSDWLTASLQSNGPAYAQIFITDVTGRNVASKKQSMRKGSNLIIVDVHSLAKGLYNITVLLDQDKITRKFLK